ncbi:MAG: leucine-rich repeat protein [Clostridia bacterium]|nr:leucine-rich repeat protein [Clostridia bacterium]
MKKYLAVLITFLMVFSAVPGGEAARALPLSGVPAQGGSAEVPVFDSLSDALGFIRTRMTQRDADISLRYNGADTITAEDIFAYAGSAPAEGDYLRFQVKELSLSLLGDEMQIRAEYRSTAEEEASVNDFIAELPGAEDLTTMTAYQKALFVYDFICENVAYAEEESGDAPYSAYGALCNGQAKCQGYALAYYRLARELGLDCRMLVGQMAENGSSVSHAWNAVKLGESWYSADPTNGAAALNRYEYFMMPAADGDYALSAQYAAGEAGDGEALLCTDGEIAGYPFDLPITGDCGDAAFWTLDPLTGVLLIDGEGAVDAFDGNDLRWTQYGAVIKTAAVGAGITALCEDCFAGCSPVLHGLPGSAAQAAAQAEGLTFHALAVSEAVPATCLAPGRTQCLVCAACETAFFGNEVIPVSSDHTDADENGECDLCGAPMDFDDEGTCGDALHWYYFDRGELIVKGTGEMYDYKSSGTNAAPWRAYRQSLKTLTVLPGVSSVGAAAFADCTALTSVDLPDTVTSIGTGAFIRCSGLAQITLPDALATLGANAFARTAIKTVEVPVSIMTVNTDALYNGAFADSKLETAVLKAGAETVPAYLFARAGALKTVVYETPDTLQSIGARAFYGCGLEAVDIPDSVSVIGAEAFANCTALCALTLPEGLTTVDANAFGRTAIKTVEVPASLATVNTDVLYNGAFAYSELETAVLKAGAETVPAYLFARAESLQTVVFETPETLKSIGKHAFYDCKTLETFVLPGAVETVGDRAFENCKSLSWAYVPSADTALGSKVFLNCASAFVLHCPAGSLAEAAAAGSFGCHTNLLFDSETVSLCSGIEYVPVTVYCEDCGFALTPAGFVTPDGHRVGEDAAVPATCTEPGLTAGTHCSVCKLVLKAQETVPAKGHTVVAIPEKAPTCTADGNTAGTKCGVCQTVFVAPETIPKTGHTPAVDPAVPATCTEAGLTEGSHCSVCGRTVKKQEIVPATGHLDENGDGTCDVCGEKTTQDSFVQRIFRWIGSLFEGWSRIISRILKAFRRR